MLTTIHKITGPGCAVKRNQCCPRLNKSNSNTVNEVFGDQPQKVIDIPVVIDVYNYNMNGIDTADQLKKCYSTHITVLWSWFSLFFFFWLLDTIIINSYLAYKRKDLINNKIPHKEFRLDTVWSLLEGALIKSNRLK